MSPRDVVAACLPDPATLGDQMHGKTCAGTWVTGTGKDGAPREVYLYHVVDNEWSMREYGSQAVVWQTAINPVVALELLAGGTWSGAGVLGPEAFDAVPFLDLLTAYGSPWGMREDGTPAGRHGLAMHGVARPSGRRPTCRRGASMPHEVQGVVARGEGRAGLAGDGPGARTPAPARRWSSVQACGVCHTDLHYREGGINDDFPFLLGHEAAGVVEAVGDGRHRRRARATSSSSTGARSAASAGPAAAGKPWYCFATHNATQKMTLADGTALQPGARHRRVRREDPGRRRPVHQGRPGRAGPRPPACSAAA